MRRTALRLLAFVVCFLLASSGAAGETVVGAKAGLVFSGIRGDDVDIYDGSLGVCGGGYVTFYVTESIGVQVEFLYVMKGAGFLSLEEGSSWWDQFDEHAGTLDLDYIEIPVLLKARASLNGGAYPYAYLGAAPAINIRAEEDWDWAWSDLDRDDTSGFDLNLVVGGGLDLDFEWLEASLDGRFELGLLSINAEGYHPSWHEEADEAYKADQNNYAFMAMLGVGFSM